MVQTLYLMRHGETLFNRLKKIQGACDSPLTTAGIAQAKSARDYFRQHRISFDVAYSSTAERAADTLEIVTDQPYQRLKGLKEANFGSYEGQPEYLNPGLPYGPFFKQFGGESDTEVRDRIKQTITQIMEINSQSASILVVAHKGVCRAFSQQWADYAEVTGTDQLNNCGILQFTYTDKIFRLMAVIDPSQNV